MLKAIGWAMDVFGGRTSRRVADDHVVWDAETSRALLTFLRWVDLCRAGTGNHVLLDEAKVIHYRHLVGSGVRTLYLPNVSVEVKGANPAVLPRSLSG